MTKKQAEQTAKKIITLHKTAMALLDNLYFHHELIAERTWDFINDEAQMRG